MEYFKFLEFFIGESEDKKKLSIKTPINSPTKVDNLLGYKLKTFIYARC